MAAVTGPTITQIRSAAVPVADQDRALDFYVGTLGFEVRIDTGPDPAVRWIEVAPPGAATTIALIGAPQADRTGVDTGIRLTATDVGTDHAALAAAGVDVDAEISRWPGVPPMFSLRDPEGNTLYVLEG
jgi:catechol 2,3-dioxygenase-like lactoylglutathione lyase family enzyme